MKRARTAVATAKPGRSTLKRKKASRNNELPASSSTLATTALDDVHFPVEQDNDEDAPMGTFDIDDMDLSHGRDDDEDADDAAASDASSIAGEDPQERRIRLAKQYIASLSRPSSTTHASSSSTSLADIPEFDAAEVDRDIIAARLRDHALEAEGRLHKPMAATLQPGPIPPSTIHHLRGGNVFRHSVTCVAVTPDERYVYAGSKCGRVVKFDVVERRVAQVVADVGRKGGSVRAIAVSHDGKYVAVGCKDLRVYGRGVGAAGEDQLLKTFKHHRDHVTVGSGEATKWRDAPDDADYD